MDYTDAVLLREASDVIWSFAGWAMQVSGNGRLSETFSRSVSAALSSAYRASSEFELPPQCVADTIEGVVWVESTGTRENRLQRIEQHEQSLYDTPDASGTPHAYALLSGRIRIYPQPTEGGIIRFQYQMRHPALISDSTSTSGTISSIADAGSGYTTFNLSAATPFAVGDYVDICSNQYPYRHLFTSLYCGTSGASAVQLYVPYSYLSGLSLSGVRLFKSGQSPYVHLPLEFRGALTAKIASNVLKDVGDLAGMQANEMHAKDELSRVLGMLSPRTKRDRPRVINPFSHMRGGRR